VKGHHEQLGRLRRRRRHRSWWSSRRHCRDGRQVERVVPWALPGEPGSQRVGPCSALDSGLKGGPDVAHPLEPRTGPPYTLGRHTLCVALRAAPEKCRSGTHTVLASPPLSHPPPPRPGKARPRQHHTADGTPSWTPTGPAWPPCGPPSRWRKGGTWRRHGCRASSPWGPARRWGRASASACTRAGGSPAPLQRSGRRQGRPCTGPGSHGSGHRARTAARRPAKRKAYRRPWRSQSHAYEGFGVRGTAPSSW
jgi:hypothetical protein